MSKTPHHDGSGPARAAQLSGPSRLRYHHDALGAVLAIIGTISSEAAVLFAAIIAVRGDRRGAEERALDRAELAMILKFPGDVELDRYLIDVGDQMTDALGLNIVDPVCRTAIVGKAYRADAAAQRSASLDQLFERPEPDAETQDPAQAPVVLSRDFVELLDNPIPPSPRSSPMPRLDPIGQEDVAMVEAVLRSGVAGHFAFRRRAHQHRDVGDLAAILRSNDHAVLLYEGLGKGCLAAILCAELHAGATQPLMLIERDLLTSSQSPVEDSWEEVVVPATDDATVTTFATLLPRNLIGARGIYLWSIPDTHVISTSSLPWIGACIGPIRFDPTWVRRIVADHLGTIEATDRSSAVTVLARRSRDPRDVGAMAMMTRAIAMARDDDIDRASVAVTASFAENRSQLLATDQIFDPRLLVCTDEAHQLLAYAKEAAANGARVLAHGPPGGGKSAFIRELARRMSAGGLVRHVGPADFLAKSWGATERLVRDLWLRASEDGAILVVDEFDVVGGRRLGGDMSNNGILIRSLTNAWLNAMDEFSNVAMLASTNDRAAVDPAIQRRAAFVLEFGDALTPTQERLAWSTILGCSPPSAWEPTGAAVADFVLAAQRSRMLNRRDEIFLENAVKTAASARQPSRTQLPRKPVGMDTRH